ncbi:MAG: hypothetical protein ACXQS3_00320 [Candidatus Methanofastidiosia archaeon]
MTPSEKNIRTYLIDYSLVAQMIKTPTKSKTIIGVLLGLCDKKDVQLIGNECGLRFLEQLMIKTRYYYLMKSFFWTHRLKTEENPSITFYIINELITNTHYTEIKLDSLNTCKKHYPSFSGIKLSYLATAYENNASIVTEDKKFGKCSKELFPTITPHELSKELF